MISFGDFLGVLGFCIRHWKLIAVLIVLQVAWYQIKAHAPAPAGAAAVSLDQGGVTQTSWAQALLASLGDQPTPPNVQAVAAWEQAEGGHWRNTAMFNPLNTTMPEPGSHPMNGVGVQAYTSWSQGMTATVATLTNGLYGGILAALRAGSCAPCVASAVAASPWGTGSFAV